MPEVKRDFRGGKMNKDLDERLVPNGEYRDALNIQVAGSEGSDVGAAQNILGTLNLGPNISSSQCIGVVADNANNKIYWFVKSTGVSVKFGLDLILEFDQYTGVITPVVVDTLNILNFNTQNIFRITAVNIIEDFLYWTDNRSEPKKIDINKFKAGSSDFSTHTTLLDQDNNSYNFSIDDVTVIKKAPIQAPTLTMSDSLRSGITESTALQFSFTDSNGDPFESGTYPVVTTPPGAGFSMEAALVTQSVMNIQPGDKLRLTRLDNEDDEEVRVTVTDLFPSSMPTVFRIYIDSVSQDISTGDQDWSVELIEEKNLFEFKFPRFAYRYKYADGQYSSFGPFSQVAFIADDFDYQPKKGYNLGMVNKLKKLTISNFVTSQMPKDVEEIDILYKEDKSANVYNVKSIKGKHNNKDEEWVNNSIDIESEVIYKVIPSMQTLRPWDNVPKLAKSQEFVANRLIYGNYTQQYDIESSDGTEITPKFEISVVNNYYNDQYETKKPGKSLKSMRTYQVGVVYQDSFGRQTPVLTDVSGSFELPKLRSVDYNSVSVKILSPKPYWATHYKYFIKETSDQYYNLSMDRHYKAEDGNVWIAFPSSERNKVDDETFLIIKKQHNSDVFVEDEARYKVIAIENDAPEFLTRTKISKGLATANSDGNLFAEGGYPEKFTNKIRIPRALWKQSFGGTIGSGDDVDLSTASIHTLSELFVRVKKGNNVTKYYEITNITYEPLATGVDYAGTSTNIPDAKYWQINIKGTFDESDVDWLGSVGDGSNIQSNSMAIEIAQERKKILPQFQGRFFVKLYRDSVLEKNITNFANLDELKITSQVKAWQVAGGANGSTNTISLNKNTGGGQGSRYSYWKKTDKSPGSNYGGLGAAWFIDRKGKNHWFSDLGGEGDISPNRNFGTSNNQISLAHSSQGFGIRAGQDIIEISYHGFGDKYKNTKNGQRDCVWEEWIAFGVSDDLEHKDFVKGLQTIDNYIKFPGDPDETLYQIKGYRRSGSIIYDGRTSGGRGRTGTFASSRVVTWTIKLDKDITWAPEDNVSNITAGAQYNTPIQVGTMFVDEDDLDGFTTTNPAIFETEPKEKAELDIYFEASDAYPTTSNHGSSQFLPYHNCYSFANGVESNRIRDDFNASQISKGVKASSTLEEQYKEENKLTGLIYSQIFNSRSGVNRLNQFIMADKITKDLNPEYGSIQLLHTRETDLLAFCEDKVVKILANKDALFNADGNANLTSSQNVLGQSIIPATFGEFGIGKNPESFASYAYRCYFTDKPRGKVLRLSMDGITEISNYGMDDYFRDKLASSDVVLGTYDDSKDLYNVTLKSNGLRNFDDTVSFMETVQGWPSRKSFIPEAGVSLNNIFYTFKLGNINSHNNNVRNNFYGVQYESKVKIVLNDGPDIIKSFNTINYEGSQNKIVQDLSDSEYYNNVGKDGWYSTSVKTDLQEGKVYKFKGKDRKFFGYVQGDATTLSNLDTREFSVQGIGQIASTTTNTPDKVTITIVENND